MTGTGEEHCDSGRLRCGNYLLIANTPAGLNYSAYACINQNL
jgi:hypothetical protein